MNHHAKQVQGRGMLNFKRIPLGLRNSPAEIQKPMVFFFLDWVNKLITLYTEYKHK